MTQLKITKQAKEFIKNMRLYDEYMGYCNDSSLEKDAQNALRTLKEHSEVNTGDWYTWMIELFLPSEIERLS